MSKRLNTAKKEIDRLYSLEKDPLISENYYIISEALRRLKSAEGELKRKKHNYIRQLTAEYCKATDFSTDKQTLTEYFTHYSSKITYSDIALLSVLLCEQAIIEISSGSSSAKPAVSMLHFAIKTNFLFFVTAVFDAERILCKDVQYKNMAQETQELVRERISAIAERRKQTGAQTAQELMDLYGEGLYSFLFPRKKHYSYFYIAAFVFCCVQLTAYNALGLYSLLSAVPSLSLALWCAGRIVTTFIVPAPVLRMRREAISEIRTTVCVTTLLNGKDEKVFDRLERFYCSNKNSNCIFTVLADLPESNLLSSPLDESIIAAATKKINSLNEKYGCFALLIRARVSNGEGIYTGRERKRGAIEALISFIADKKDCFMVAEGNTEGIKTSKYVLTLDSDTNLTTGNVSELLTAAEHPVNKAVIKNGKPVSGFGVLQPRMTATIASAGKSIFSRIIAGTGGLDVYENASFGTTDTVFGQGLFCGKGLINVNSYKALVSGVLPDKKVLSHDIPEGALLRTLYLPDTTLSDSTPTTVLAYIMRGERWARGDIQNLFILSRIKSACGRYAILENFLRVLSPVISFLSVCAAAVLNASSCITVRQSYFILLFALLPVIVPPFVGLLASPARIYMIAVRRSFARVASSAVLDAGRLCYSIFSFGEEACLNGYALCKSFYRMLISHRRRLEWVTAAQAESKAKDSLLCYINQLLLSALLGGALFFLAPEGVFRLLGLIWFSYPLVAFLISRKTETKKRKVDIEHYTEYAREMFAFYEDYVNNTTHFLPPDNVSIAPVYSIAMRTSPTNIGMYLLSMAAAADFGFIDSCTLRTKISETFNTLERLERWHGHFYNWYDLNNLEVIGERYVSTVDSGNLVASLTALRSALLTHGLKEEAERAKALAAADFAALYDKERELFHLGYNGATDSFGDICYDLYMSESRITSYYAVAECAVPKKHWKKLSRTLIEDDGYIGMASWTGTAFEYFMASLFLPSPENSFVKEALDFAFYEQKKHSINGIWGVSESGFFAFDADMNYQYRAFGISKLGLKHYTDDEPVVSPYSTFLMIGCSPKAAERNFERYGKLGMRGKYGFYEAYDFSAVRTEAGAPVKSYMSHHVGMSMTALANLCFEDIFVRRFMSDVRMDAARELLEEKIPEPNIYKDIMPPEKEDRETSHDRLSHLYERADYNAPVSCMLSNGQATVLATSLGHISVRKGDVILNDFLFDRYGGRTLSVKIGDTVVNTAKASLERGNGRIVYIMTEGDRIKRATFALSGGTAVIEAFSCYGETASIELYPAFDYYRSYQAHPAFSLLFLRFEYDREDKILYVVRRFRGSTKLFWGAIASEKELDLNYSVGDNTSNRDGCVKKPFVTCTVDKGERAGFYITCAYTKEQAGANINSARTSGADKALSEDGSELLSELLYPSGGYSTAFFPVTRLWSFGISGELPLIFLDEPKHQVLKDYLVFFRSLAVASIRTELLIHIHDQDAYSRENERSARKLISSLGCDGFVDRRGGIRLVREMSRAECEFARCMSFNLKEKAASPLYENKEIIARPLSTTRSDFIGAVLHAVHGGVFTGDGFVIDRSYKHASVWSWVLAGRCFGSVVTQDSLGFTYFADSRNCRLTRFLNDTELTAGGERLIICCGEERYDACACADYVYLKKGYAEYYGSINSCSYKVTVFCSEKWCAKYIAFESSRSFKTVFTAVPSNPGHTIFVPHDDTAITQGEGMAYLPDSKLFVAVSCVKECNYQSSYADILDGQAAECSVMSVSSTGNTVYALSGARSLEANIAFRSRLCKEFYEAELANTVRFVDAMLPKKKIEIKPSLDVMYNFFLPYQIAASRFFGRTGFFQSSGAYGFRDQLQDCLALVHMMPEAVRTHIIRCAAHQYDDGSVMHWFLPIGVLSSERKNNPVGVRTRCSDDFMYLPLLTAEYINHTGDRSILGTEIYYLTSPELNQPERYEEAAKSEIKESLYQHCLRALKYSERRGTHGLPLIGSCDWNDGFSNAGVKGIGESVLNAELYIYVYEKFIPLIQEQDTALADHYRALCYSLREAVAESFQNGYFLRAYTDTGEKIGSIESKECKIDVASQAFAAIAKAAPHEMISTALDTAYAELYDRNNKILKLLAPAFRENKRDIGYIQAYNPGIRENGGQYTHAAAQMLVALWGAGKQEQAYELLSALNPAVRCAKEGNRELAYRYGAEPYAMCGDIYSAGRLSGVGGWSQYTGSAAWYWLAIREILGL